MMADLHRGGREIPSILTGDVLRTHHDDKTAGEQEDAKNRRKLRVQGLVILFYVFLADCHVAQTADYVSGDMT